MLPSLVQTTDTIRELCSRPWYKTTDTTRELCSRPWYKQQIQPGSCAPVFGTNNRYNQGAVLPSLVQTTDTIRELCSCPWYKTTDTTRELCSRPWYKQQIQPGSCAPVFGTNNRYNQGAALQSLIQTTHTIRDATNRTKKLTFYLLQERDTEGQRETETETDRRICFRTLASCQSYRVTYPDDINRQTQTDGYRQIGRHRQTGRRTDRHIRQTGRRAGRQAGKHRQAGRPIQTGKRTNRQTGRQTQTDRPTDTNRQAGRQTNKETERVCGSYTGLVLHSSPGLQQFPCALHVTNGRRHAQWGQSQLAAHSHHS